MRWEPGSENGVVLEAQPLIPRRCFEVDTLAGSGWESAVLHNLEKAQKVNEPNLKRILRDCARQASVQPRASERVTELGVGGTTIGRRHECKNGEAGPASQTQSEIPERKWSERERRRSYSPPLGTEQEGRSMKAN